MQILAKLVYRMLGIAAGIAKSSNSRRHCSRVRTQPLATRRMCYYSKFEKLSEIPVAANRSHNDKSAGLKA